MANDIAAQVLFKAIQSVAQHVNEHMVMHQVIHQVSVATAELS